MGDSKPFFDRPENQPYAEFLRGHQFPWVVDTAIDLLKQVRQSDLATYSTPKGTPFYVMGIAAFASHDYQTATFFFDAAVAEDVTHYPGDNDKPALQFMRLDATKQEQAAKQIVEAVSDKLVAVLKNYAGRSGSKALSLPDLRKHFLDHLERPGLRTLTTTFVSFLAEWDYRSRMIDLPTQTVSSEPFFTHLFRGCLLFESLLKDKASVPLPEAWLSYVRRLLRERKLFDRRKNRLPITLGALLEAHRKALGIGKVKIGASSFEEVVLALKTNESLGAAIQCTARTRNTLGHNLAWTAESLDRHRYDFLASNIAASCLHAIACLYMPSALEAGERRSIEHSARR
jgi:hypothetical protein